MKKTFLTRRNAIISGRLSWGSYLLILAVVLLLLRVAAPNAFWRVVSPVFTASHAVSERTHGFFAVFADAAAREAELDRLKEENAALTTQNGALTAQLADISALPKGGSSNIVAGVVARPPESAYDTLILDRGALDGVMRHMEVFGEGGVPLGVVSNVFANFSQVTLLSSPAMRFSALIETPGAKQGTAVLVSGTGGGTFAATVARSTEIHEGDTVSITGPGSLPIGTVIKVENDPSAPTVTLRIQSVTNPFTLSWVSLRDMGVSISPLLLAATSTTP